MLPQAVVRSGNSKAMTEPFRVRTVHAMDDIPRRGASSAPPGTISLAPRMRIASRGQAFAHAKHSQQVSGSNTSALPVAESVRMISAGQICTHSGAARPAQPSQVPWSTIAGTSDSHLVIGAAWQNWGRATGSWAPGHANEIRL